MSGQKTETRFPKLLKLFEETDLKNKISPENKWLYNAFMSVISPRQEKPESDDRD